MQERVDAISAADAMDPKVWEQAHERLERNIVGIILCEASRSPDITDILSPHERAQKHYWDLVWEYDGDLIVFQVLEGVPLVRPQPVYALRFFLWLIVLFG